MVALRDGVVTAFRKCFLWDAAVAQTGSLADYQSMFPGFEDVVRAEYEKISSEHEAAPPRARTIGHYRIGEFLGRGGQGSVHAAEDVRDGTLVALKLLATTGDPARRLERLRREAEAIARLDHESICRIHEAGLEGDVPYLAMRHVPGTTLARRIADARRDHPGALGTVDASSHLGFAADAQSPGRARPAAACALFFERAARAVHAAHEAGLVHRDVKPGNVMVTPSGAPVVLDFGLARDEEEGATITRTGAFLGTPAYMSPEQLEDGTRLDRRADVYALGVCLFEALTLMHPLEAAPLETRARSVAAGELGDLRDLDPRFPADLALVVATATRRDRDRRYPSALALAEDVRAYRLGLPLRARPPTVAQRLGDWARRHPAVAASSLVAFASLAAGLAMSQRLLADTREALRGESAALAAATRSRESANELVGVMLGDFKYEVLRLSRIDVLEKSALAARAHFDGLPREDLSEAELSACADAYGTLGTVFEFKGPARAAEALECWGRSLEIRELLHRRHPENVAHARALADSLSADARRARQQGRTEAAVASFERADAVLEEISDPVGRDLVVRKDRIHLLRGLAMAHRATGRMHEALRQLRRAAAVGDEAMRLVPDEVVTEVQSAHVDLQIAETLDQTGDATAARDGLQRTLRRFRELVAKHPSDPFPSEGLVDVLYHVSERARERGDHAEAEAAAAEMTELCAKLRAAEPARDRSRVVLIFGIQSLALARAGLGRFREALDAAERARAMSESAEDCAVLTTLGEVSLRAGDIDAAIAALAESGARADRAVSASPSDLDVRADFVRQRTLLGEALAHASRRAGPTDRTQAQELGARALAVLEEAAATSQRVVADCPEAARFARMRAVALREIAAVRRALGDLPGASAALAEAIEVRDALAARDPSFVAQLADLDGLLAEVGAFALSGSAAGAAERGPEVR